MAIIGMSVVSLSVCHVLVLYQNDAS